jgi:hypothetical protein
VVPRVIFACFSKSRGLAADRSPRSLGPWNAAELRQRAVALEADLWPDHAEDRRGAAELLGEAGSGSAGRDLLADAVECAEDETGVEP